MQYIKLIKEKDARNEMQLKKNLGQYFTPPPIADFMVELIESGKDGRVFEPCAGEGVFLESLKKIGFTNVLAYELDSSLKNKSSGKITYKDTLFEPPKEKFNVIIGNPPYVRWKNIDPQVRLRFKEDALWKKKINGLNDLLYPFIILSVESLKEGGELIFVTPTFWTSTTHSKLVRKKLQEEGEITHYINFEEMKLFDNVSSNILIFRFVKKKGGKKMKVINVKNKGRLNYSVLKDIKEIIQQLNHEETLRKEGYEGFLHNQFENDDLWIPIRPEIKPIIDKIEKGANAKLGEIFDIGNGMVSGLDEAFKINEIKKLNNYEQKSVINVVKAKNLRKYFHEGSEPYIFLNDLNLTEDKLGEMKNIKEQLLSFKENLLKRYGYNKEISWWDWVFLRNRKMIEKELKIVVPCKERFDSKDHVRFSLVKGNYYVTQDATALVKKDGIKEDVLYFLGILNSRVIFEWLKNRGLKRGGVLEFSERPLSVIPIKRINWDKKREVDLYNDIVSIVKNIIEEKDYNSYELKIDTKIKELYGLNY